MKKQKCAARVKGTSMLSILYDITVRAEESGGGGDGAALAAPRTWRTGGGGGRWGRDLRVRRGCVTQGESNACGKETRMSHATECGTAGCPRVPRLGQAGGLACAHALRCRVWTLGG